MIPKNTPLEAVEKYILNKAESMKLKLKILKIFYIVDYSTYYKYFNNRSLSYFKLKPLINAKGIGMDEKIIKMKSEIFFYNEYLKI